MSNAVIDSLSAPKVFAIQINDAPQQAGENIIVETLQHRLLPGEGDINLNDILERLHTSGCTAPLGIEVFSTKLAGLPASTVAQRAADSIRALRRVSN